MEPLWMVAGWCCQGQVCHHDSPPPLMTPPPFPLPAFEGEGLGALQPRVCPAAILRGPGGMSGPFTHLPQSKAVEAQGAIL